MYNNMNSWFERLASLTLSFQRARAEKNYDRADDMKAWMADMGSYPQVNKDGSVGYKGVNLSSALAHDIGNEITRRFHSNENYKALMFANQAKLLAKAVSGIPVAVLLKQTKLDLFLFRAGQKVRNNYLEWRMRVWHKYTWKLSVKYVQLKWKLGI